MKTNAEGSMLKAEEPDFNAETLRAQRGAEVARQIENQMWDGVEKVGNQLCWFGISDYDGAQMAAYAKGLAHAIEGIAQALALATPDYMTENFAGALGERLARLNSEPKLHWPTLNNALRQVRARRIAMLDRHEAGMDYKEYREFRRCLDRLRARVDRCELSKEREQLFDEEFRLVNDEFRALEELKDHLMHDKSWWARHYELHLRKPTPTPPTTNPPAPGAELAREAA
jgi:hypothetical protein